MKIMGRKLSVMPGMKFGLLTVTDKRDGPKVVCICTCGNEISVLPYRLRMDGIYCCKNCRPKLTVRGHKRGKIVAGDWIGALQAVEKVGVQNKYAIWKFKCICGGVRTTTATEAKRYFLPHCRMCGKNNVGYINTFIKTSKDNFKGYYDVAVQKGFKLYDMGVTPPELIYDPGKGTK